MRFEPTFRTGMPNDATPTSASGASPARVVKSQGSALTAMPGLVVLVAEMARGRQEALADLYDQTSPIINGLLHRILEHEQDAEEVLLDVYMKAWKNAASYSEKRGSVQAWLIIMARNAAIDRIRQRQAQPRALDLDPDGGVDPEAPDPSPELRAAMAQRRRHIRHLLRELPQEQRDAVVLAFFGGLTHSELAERLGEPLGTVKSRIRMGLIRLRTLLEEADAL
jgi:RNA polymerase sigma-70 factor, ECF subfamily